MEEKIDKIMSVVLETNVKVDSILQRLETVEANHANLESRVARIESEEFLTVNDMEEITYQIKKSSQESYDEMKEQCDRMRRESNIILMGIQESHEGELLIDDLLETILPPNTAAVLKERVGKPSAEQKNPRPMRIVLANSLLKRQTLRNCKALKGLEKFKNISVKPDLTKIQQQERNSPVQTRSRKRRKMDEIVPDHREELSIPPSKKN